jgi:hypothetical protein
MPLRDVRRIRKVAMTEVKLEYIPAPDGDRKYNLISYWTVTWPVIDDKYKDRKSAGRRNLEHSEQKKDHS